METGLLGVRLRLTLTEAGEVSAPSVTVKRLLVRIRRRPLLMVCGARCVVFDGENGVCHCLGLSRALHD